MAQFWYDVCNDMTLSLRETKETPSDIVDGEWIANGGHFWKGVSFSLDEEEGPIYFLSSVGDLEGKELDY